jgi:RNA polymerase sigma factor for flagellar operon FliA
MQQGGASAADPEPERSLWEEYGRTRQPETRQRLVQRYMDMTHRIAAHLFGRRFGNAVAFDDYLQYARVGLLEAIDRYEPAREASFATFAGYRIRGAVLNGLEQTTELAAQAAQRRHSRLRERADSFETRDHGNADDGDASVDAEFAGTQLDQFSGMVDMTILLAMGYVLEDNGEWNPAGASGADPYRSVQLEAVRSRLIRLVDALPQRERLIVRYHYFEHMEFQAIGEVLEVSKGRISQLHARALQLIREGYEALEQFDVEL